MSASEEASRDFAAAFRTMVEWVHATGVPGGANAVVALIHDHLGPDRVGGSVVSRELAPFEQVNLQVALDTWSRAPGRVVRAYLAGQ